MASRFHRQRKTTSTHHLPTVVIVGGGMAAHWGCRQMVAKGGQRQYQLIMFAEETHPPYDRVKLTDFFRTRNPDHLLLDTVSWYQEHAIDLRLGDAVVGFDRSQQMVQAAAGAKCSVS
jgi:nitrite reductase (NADH) large subunit